MAFIHPSRLQRIQSGGESTNNHHHHHHHQHGAPPTLPPASQTQASEAAFAAARSRVPLPEQTAQFSRTGAPVRESRPGGARRDHGPLPPVHAVLPGVVQSIQSFGAFVAMDGFGQHGLVHVSQLADRRVEQPSEVVAVGQRVFVKVLSVNVDDHKCSLSMKLVDQTSGRDLDTEHFEATRFADGGGAGGRGPARPAPLQIGAVLNTTCTRCHRPGHLATECFGSRHDASYDLIGSDDENVRKAEHVQREVAARAEEKRVRHALRDAARAARAERREGRKRRHSSSRSGRRHRHHRKHKSRRRKSGSDSDSDSSSASSSASGSSSSSSSRSRSRHRGSRSRDRRHRHRSRSPRDERRRRSRSPERRREPEAADRPRDPHAEQRARSPHAEQRAREPVAERALAVGPAAPERPATPEEGEVVVVVAAPTSDRPRSPSPPQPQPTLSEQQ